MFFFTVLSTFVFIIVSCLTFLYPRFSPFKSIKTKQSICAPFVLHQQILRWGRLRRVLHQLVQHDRGLFHFHRSVFSSQLKSKVGSTLVKTTTLLVNLNLDRTPITSKSHTHPSHSETVYHSSSVTFFPLSLVFFYSIIIKSHRP